MRNEMVTLIDKLENSEIPFEVTMPHSKAPIVWYPSTKNPICSVFCLLNFYDLENDGSLTIMGAIDKKVDKGVEDSLTANDVFARIYTDYMNK